mmetsp:Transcript_9721/g.26928  ORF Transcript_9721/g.26928 Transcript_9721/m.26928 type:complete len:211 (+) Transcript_9721:125-757(+)
MCDAHDHDHDHGDDLGLSLLPYIDLARVVCYNEEVNGSGQKVFKIHEERLTATPSVTSPEDDPELLFYIPFTETVTVKHFSIRNGSTNGDTAAPRRVKIFTNRDDIDFETARELPAHQETILVEPEHIVDGTVDYPARPASKFTNITSIAMYVQDNFDDSGEAPTEITFVGFKGKGTKMKRVAVEAVYETRGMKKDHKVKGEFGAKSDLF